MIFFITVDEGPLPFFLDVLYNKNTLILNFSQYMGVCVACSSVIDDEEMIEDLCPDCAEESGLPIDDLSDEETAMDASFEEDVADEDMET